MTTEIVSTTTGEVVHSTAMELQRPLTAADVINNVGTIQSIMKKVMKDGTHYGTIPGTGKPSLYQPGAQILGLTFRLAPEYEVQQTDLGNGHREYTVTCKLYSTTTGQLMGSGIGLCSTMESKYRYRNTADWSDTGEPIPVDAKERKKEYRAQGLGMKNVDGVWLWVKYGDSQRSENPDIADTYNTVLKMASKRAYVHAILNVTAASDMFTQDVEDFERYEAPPTAPKRDMSELTALKARWADRFFEGDTREAGKDILSGFGDPRSMSDTQYTAMLAAITEALEQTPDVDDRDLADEDLDY